MLLHAFSNTFITKIIPLLLALIGFGVLITVHEFGHFFFSKLFGIHTPTFSIGFGPTIYKKKIGETTFRIAAIPLGGYTEIAGFSEAGQGEQKYARDTSQRSFSAKPYWQKFFVIMGGILFNILFAYFVLSGIYMIGMPQRNAAITIHSIVENSAAQAAGIQKGDTLLAVNNQPFSQEARTVMNEMQKTLLPQITQNPNKTITLRVSRNGQEQDIAVKLGSKILNGKIIGELGAMFGVMFTMAQNSYKSFPFLQSIKNGIRDTHSYIVQIFYGIKSMIARRSLKGAGGPIMILSMSFGMAQRGLRLLLLFLAIISINLAILNMLPLGILDGGRLLIITIEALIRHQIPDTIRLILDLGFWIFFMWLLLLLTYRDLVTIFSK
jgi:regulator of sigma E protease